MTGPGRSGGQDALPESNISKDIANCGSAASYIQHPGLISCHPRYNVS